MVCVVCGSPIVAKRRDAKYCSNTCKALANKKLDSLEKYRTSVHGRAVALWHNSRRRNSEHTITVEWISEILEKGSCQVTGLPFDMSCGKGRSPFTPSLDREDSTKGYTPENTRVVIWMYNTAKNVFTDEEVLIMANALVNKNGSMK